MKTSTLSRRYGWRPDTPDARDYRYRAPRRVLEALPPMVDLTSVCPPVYDQTTLGSCTGNAIGSAHQFEQIKQLLSGTDAVAIVAAITQSFIPSRLFIYWNERDMEGSVGYDAGAEIRDGIKSVVNQGVCPESMWPYDISKFRDKPPEACYTDAMNHQVVVYQRIDQTLEQLKGSLAAGYPVVFGFSVYESFETNEVARTGEAPMPKAGESLLGGHAVKLVGYNDAIQRWKVKNSWGTGWGDKGYFTLPYEYLTNSDLSADFWNISLVEMSSDDIHDVPTPTPNPQPNFPCDLSLVFPAAKAFVDGAVKGAMRSTERTQTDRMIESGFVELQAYLQRVENIRNRQK